MDDCRQGGKVIYRLHDCLMSAFAMMLFQDSSLNTLKNQGYHLDLTDRLYQAVRYTKFTSRKEFWNQLRCTLRILVFRDFEHMLGYILHPARIMPP